MILGVGGRGTENTVKLVTRLLLIVQEEPYITSTFRQGVRGLTMQPRNRIGPVYAIRAILAHGEIIESGAKPAIERAWRFARTDVKRVNITDSPGVTNGCL